MGFEEMFGNEPLPGDSDATTSESNTPPAGTSAFPVETPPVIPEPAGLDGSPPPVGSAVPAGLDGSPPPVGPAVPAAPVQPQPHDQLVSAITEERARRRELQQQNEQLQARFNELLMRVTQQQQPAQQQQIPSYDENPAEYLRAMQQQHAHELQQLREQVVGQNQRVQVTDQHSQLVNAVAAHESEFAARTPDYHAATAFVQQRKLAEYKAIGLTDVEARQALARDTMSVAQLALQRGQNPAEVMYGLAKTVGYQTLPPGATQTGAVQRPAAPSSLQTSGGAPGADVAGQPTPDALANMSDAEFDTWWNKMAASTKGARPLQ